MIKPYFLLMMVIAGCSNPNFRCATKVASIADYKNPEKCWINGDGEIEVFVILSKGRDAYFPTILSKTCKTPKKFENELVFLQAYKPLIALADNSGVLPSYTSQREKISWEYLDHRPAINEHDSVFALKVAGNTKQNGQVLTIDISKFSRFDRVGDLRTLLNSRASCR